MTTWYVDYEGGTDANASVGNGDSFATRRKKIDNCVAAAIAPGDTIRVMGSPAPTLLGNATWTDGPLPATQSITSSTNATPIVVTKASHGYANGDTVIISGHTTNTNANGVWTVANVATNTFELKNADGTNSVGNGVGGASGTVRKFTNAVVTLASAVTQNIALCGNQGQKVNWTASANVTCSIIANGKEGYGLLSLAIAAGFTTGKAAYYTLPSTLNLSSYQQVSFWCNLVSGTVGAAGAVRIALCSDATGDTVVHSCPLPYHGTNVGQWIPVVVDLATNLSSGINSIAFYVNTDNGAQTYYLDHIIACKAASDPTSLNLTSLISKDPGDHTYGDGYECWWGIQSINGTRVVLDGISTSIPGSSPQRGYSGTTETVATYKRETIKTVAVSGSTYVQTTTEAGTSSLINTISGGWNRTDMSTQTGETWFDGQNGLGYALAMQHFYWTVTKVNLTRYSYGIADLNGGLDIGISQCCNISTNPFTSGFTKLTATTLSAVACGGPITPGTAAVVQTIGRADCTTSGNGVTLASAAWVGTVKSASNNAAVGASSGTNGEYGTIEKASGNATSGVSLGVRTRIGSVTAANNGAFGLVCAEGNIVLGGSTSGNASGGVQQQNGKATLRNFTINEATEVSGFTAYNDGRVYSEKHDGTANYSVIFCDGGLIRTDATVVHGSATRSWKFSPTSTNRSQYYPLNQSIAKVAVAANSLVTIKGWFRRDNTGLTGKLVCKGGQIAGVASDVSSSIAASANTWEELTITFTPTEAGVVDIEAQFWGGTSYNGWVSDLTISQA